jgi:hypothetical protein
MIAALAWPGLLAARDVRRRRRILRRLPYVAPLTIPAEPDLPVRSQGMPCCGADLTEPSPVASDDRSPWRAAEVASTWQADASAAHPHDVAIRSEPPAATFATDGSMIAMDTSPRGAIASGASSHDLPDDGQSVLSRDLDAAMLSAAPPPAAAVSIAPPAGFAVADTAAPTVTVDDAAPIDCPEARPTLVAAGDGAAPLILLTPPSHAMLALLTMDGALDEAAADALAHAGRHDDTAAAPGLALPSHEQPDDADRGTVDEPDWWEQAVVVVESPPSIVTLRSGRPAINPR